MVLRIPPSIRKFLFIFKNRGIITSSQDSVSGLVVKFVVAIDEPGVRFPPNASTFLRSNLHFWPPGEYWDLFLESWSIDSGVMFLE